MSMNTKHVVPLTDEVTLIFTHDVLTGEIVDVVVIDIGNRHVKHGAQPRCTRRLGLAGRAQLAAHFLEDLVLPSDERSTHAAP